MNKWIYYGDVIQCNYDFISLETIEYDKDSNTFLYSSSRNSLTTVLMAGDVENAEPTKTDFQFALEQLKLECDLVKAKVSTFEIVYVGG